MTEETEPWNGLNDEDDESQVCSVPGCGRHHWDDGAPLTDFRVIVLPGEEGYSDVSQLLCMQHSDEIRRKLIDLGFGSHNHHGTCTLDAEDTCGGYGKCQTPAEYGPELVRPAASSYKKVVEEDI